MYEVYVKPNCCIEPHPRLALAFKFEELDKAHAIIDEMDQGMSAWVRHVSVNERPRWFYAPKSAILRRLQSESYSDEYMIAHYKIAS